MPLDAGKVFAGYRSVSIKSGPRQVNGGRRVGMVGVAVLAAMALGPDPAANAGPAPVCPQGPGPGVGCAGRAFLADLAAAGLGNSDGGLAEVNQGLDICGLMDGGLSPQSMVSQFAANNPALGPEGAAQVVRIAIRDLCPWH